MRIAAHHSLVVTSFKATAENTRSVCVCFERVAVDEIIKSPAKTWGGSHQDYVHTKQVYS